MLDILLQVLTWLIRAFIVVFLIVGTGLLIMLIVAEFKDHQ